MSKPTVRNSADPKQVRFAAQREKFAAEQQEADLKALMATPEGRRFMRRLVVDICGIYRSTHLSSVSGRGSDQPFLEGQRNVGLTLLSEIQGACPRQWLLTEAEALEAKQKQEESDA